MSICIPACVEILGRYAFITSENASAHSVMSTPLTKLSFEPGSRLRTIKARAFVGCFLLDSICLPASVENITGESFLGSHLREISVASGNPFFRMSNNFLVNFKDKRAIRYFCLQSTAVIPTEIESIGRHCCSGLLSLTQVTFASPSCLSLIETLAFAKCSTLESVVLPPSVEILENQCFEFCVCLKWVAFPPDSKLREIGVRAFQWCSLLTGLTIPASVEHIDDDCFDECESLFPLSFASPSRLRELSLPRLIHRCQSIPDAVEELTFFTNPDKSIASVLTFGRESTLQEIRRDYRERKVPGRVFLQFSSRSLKGMRLRLEFGWNR
jgi:hypothetical protein